MKTLHGSKSCGPYDEPVSVRVLTWNVWWRFGPWEQRQPAILATLQKADADIVCCTTTSKTPLFDDADLKPGVHINAVGSYTPQAREVPPETVCRALVVVDSRHAAWEEAGDLIQPRDAGLINEQHIHAELGELVLGSRPGRSRDDEITFFKSVGLAVQDAVAARFALDNAMRLKLGQEVAW